MIAATIAKFGKHNVQNLVGCGCEGPFEHMRIFLPFGSQVSHLEAMAKYLGRGLGGKKKIPSHFFVTTLRNIMCNFLA